jgi:hypothetical protein
MNKILTIAAVTAILISATGCQKLGTARDPLPEPGTSRNLGKVPSSRAFAAAEKIVKKYFQIESIDSTAGVIKTKPAKLDSGKNLIPRISPVRQTATLMVSRSGDIAVGRVCVVQEREYSHAKTKVGHNPTEHNYSGNPGEESTIKAMQNTYWVREKSRRDIEIQLLEEIAAELK